MQPKVSIIVINYNGGNEVFRFIDSLIDLKYRNKHIIIVDNASKDNSGINLKKDWKGNSLIEVLLNNKNVGYTAGCNIGIERAVSCNSKYIVITNYDVEIINYKIIQQMVDFMETTPKIGIAGPKVYINKNGEIQNTVIVFTTLLGYIVDWIRGNILKTKKSYRIEKPIEVDAVNGVFAMYRAQVFKEIGLFDPYLNMYGDEIDIGFRAKKDGWSVWVLPFQSIIHKPSGNYEFFEVRNFLSKRNKIYLANKFYSKITSFCWFMLALLNIIARIVVLECKDDVGKLKKGKKFLRKFVKEVFKIWKCDLTLNL